MFVSSSFQRFSRITESGDNELSENNPVAGLTRKNGKRPGAMLRFNPPNPNEGSIRVYPGKLK